MKDKWINVNYENDELRPYEEPSQDFSDNYRIGTKRRARRRLCFHWTLFSHLENMIRDSTYVREQIVESLSTRKYDDIMAFYLLLGLRKSEVRETANNRSIAAVQFFFSLSLSFSTIHRTTPQVTHPLVKV
jgi:MAP/microtubule affinity-regulating kinase